MAKFINLIQHPISVAKNDGTVIVIEPTLPTPKSTFEMGTKIEIDGLTIYDAQVKAFDIPVPQSDTYYIVTRMMGTYAPGRTDLLVPVFSEDQVTVEYFLKLV